MTLLDGKAQKIREISFKKLVEADKAERDKHDFWV